MYEYIEVNAQLNQMTVLVNEKAKEGWRVVGFSAGGTNGYQMFALLERPVKS